MTHLLLITTLDVEGRRNNREHHVIRHFKKHYDQVTVVYRKRGQADQGLLSLLHTTIARHSLDGVQYVSVNPPLNPPEGAVRNMTHAGSGRAGLLRRPLAAIIDRIGILRDYLTIRALTRAAIGALDAGQENQVTACEAFGPWAAAAAYRLRRAGKINAYAYVDRDFEPGFMTSRTRRNWAVRAEFRAAAHADLTLSIGHRLAARFVDVAQAKVRISPTGVDLETFTPRLRTTPHPDLVFIGQVADWSGIEEVLEALVLLRHDHPTRHLTILGPAESGYRTRIIDMIARLDLQSVVDWHGDCPRDQVSQVLSQSAIGLATFRPHPLRTHAAPLKLLEYMASGLPVIAVKGSEAGDLITRYECGLQCATTPKEIAATIRQLVTQPAAYHTMSDNALKSVQAYEWAKILEQEHQWLVEMAGPDAEVPHVLPDLEARP